MLVQTARGLPLFHPGHNDLSQSLELSRRDVHTGLDDCHWWEDLPIGSYQEEMYMLDSTTITGR